MFLIRHVSRRAVVAFGEGIQDPTNGAEPHESNKSTTTQTAWISPQVVEHLWMNGAARQPSNLSLQRKRLHEPLQGSGSLFLIIDISSSIRNENYQTPSFDVQFSLHNGMGIANFRYCRRRDPWLASPHQRTVLHNSPSRPRSHSRNDSEYRMGLRKYPTGEYDAYDVHRMICAAVGRNLNGPQLTPVGYRMRMRCPTMDKRASVSIDGEGPENYIILPAGTDLAKLIALMEEAESTKPGPRVLPEIELPPGRSKTAMNIWMLGRCYRCGRGGQLAFRCSVECEQLDGGHIGCDECYYECRRCIPCPWPTHEE